MQQAPEQVPSSELSHLVVHGMQEKKAEDVVLVDLREIKHAVADFFVICSGNSDTQIEAIADAVEDEVKKATRQSPWKREGREHCEWVLIDYVDVVAHVFNKEKRKHYGLEELWGDAHITHMEASN